MKKIFLALILFLPVFISAQTQPVTQTPSHSSVTLERVKERMRDQAEEKKAIEEKLPYTRKAKLISPETNPLPNSGNRKNGNNSPSTTTLIYSQNFDTPPVDWVAVNLGYGNGGTLWHTTNTQASSPPLSSVSNDPATNLYPPDYHEAYESPSIYLPTDASVIFASFKFLTQLAYNPYSYTYDYFGMEVSTDDGDTWQTFSQYGYFGFSETWYTYPDDLYGWESGELTQYAGQTIKFRFVVTADGDTYTAAGLFIDDFAINAFYCDSDPYEPNDGFELATPIAYGQNTEGALICPREDTDYFSFEAQQGEFVVLTVDSPNYLDVYLYNPDNIAVVGYYNGLEYVVEEPGTYRIGVSGYYGYQNSSPYTIYLDTVNIEPDVVSVRDIPEDQGKQVRVMWRNAYYDPQYGDSYIQKYALWRKVIDSTGAANRNALSFDSFSDVDVDAVIASGSPFSVNTELWDFVQEIPAVENRPFEFYNFVAPTLRDNELTTFIVCAIPFENYYQYPILWGRPGGGLSTDDLAPAFRSTGIDPTADGSRLFWDFDASVLPDVHHVKVHRSIIPGFTPSANSLIGMVDAERYELDDNAVANTVQYYYILQVFDHAGNFTNSSVIASTVTGVNDGSVPTEFSLEQNYPNPFNPTTVIRFALPEASAVSIKVFSTIGEQVAEIVNSSLAAGYHEATFDASALPSGIYIYRIQAGAFNESKKMILQK